MSPFPSLCLLASTLACGSALVNRSALVRPSARRGADLLLGARPSTLPAGVPRRLCGPAWSQSLGLVGARVERARGGSMRSRARLRFLVAVGAVTLVSLVAAASSSTAFGGNPPGTLYVSPTGTPTAA